ncbi:MAG: serpin family protein [Planctomycetia bacterium]|nr:serpin family protein [Planctomycetia bacterium]
MKKVSMLFGLAVFFLPSVAFSQDLADSVSAFSWDLLRASVQEQEKETNLFLAPLTVFLPLESLAAGADGETRKEMLETLHLKSLDQAELEATRTFRNACNRTLRQANVFAASRFWVDASLPLSPEYQELLKTYFNTEIAPIDLRENLPDTITEINAWYNRQTYGTLPDVLSPDMIDRETRFFLGATLYFQCNWSQPFDPRQTTDAPFTRLDGTKTNVRLMTGNQRVAWRDTETFRAVRLSYVGSSLSSTPLYEMVVLLPKKTDGLPQVRESLSPEMWKQLFPADNQGWTTELGRVSLPQFTMETTIPLNTMLQNMGMKRAFVPGQAEFPRMEPSGTLYLQNLLLKTTLVVNEQGTVASAAFLGGGGVMGGMSEILKATHPFLFVIRDRWTGAILFVGQFLHD